MGLFSSLIGSVGKAFKGIGKSFGSIGKGIKGWLVGDNGTVEPTEFYDYEQVLESERAKVRPLINEANVRYDKVTDSGYLSTALDYANGSGGRFDVERATTIEEVLVEAQRAQVFLNDETSTVEGALQYDAMIHTNESEISGGAYTEGDSAMWEAFRMLQELNPTGVAVYGSDNLVNALYNAIEHGHEPLQWGIDVLNAQYENRQNEWTSAVGTIPFIW